MRKIFACLDLGSDMLKLVVGESFKGKINILASVSNESKGIKEGFIDDAQVLMPKIKELFKKAEEILGISITKVILSIPSLNVKFHMNEGYSTIYKEETTISNEDLIRAMQASSYNQIDDNEELASIMPISFKVDEEVVSYPVGKVGKKCSVKTIFTTVPKKNVIPFIKVLQKLGIEVIDTTFGAIGDYYELKSKKNDEEVGAIINIGYDITEVSIFNKGVLTNIKPLNIGAKDIEHDLCYIYKITNREARNLRMNFCLAHGRGSSTTLKRTFTNKLGEELSLSEYEVTSVASSRLSEILKLAKKEINHLTKKEIHYIIITGGVSEMTNFNYLVEEVFGHLAKIGVTKEIGVRDNMYSATVGLIKYYLDKLKLRNQEYSILSDEDLEDLSGIGRKISINENSLLGKLFGYFFDN